MDSNVFSRSAQMIGKAAACANWQIGAHILQYDSESDHPENLLITGTHEVSEEILSQFFQFANPLQTGGIQDAGILQIHDSNKVTGFWLHLLETRKTFVSIHQDLIYIPEIFNAFDIRERPFQALVLAESPLDLPEESYPAKLFQCHYMGTQAHLFNPQLSGHRRFQSADTLRLGNLRQDLEQAEPIIRNADLLVVHINVLKSAELGGLSGVGASGLNSEALCQLGRYMGFSDKLKAICICGLPENSPLGEQGSNVLAQFLWYFYQGFSSRKQDFPARKDHLVEYLIEAGPHSATLHFFKSELSDRWWFRIPETLPAHYAEHEYLPCSFREYEQTCLGEIPERLMKAMQRFEDL